MNFHFYRHVIRRCKWLAIRTVISFGQFIFVGPLVLASSAQKMQCGRLRVYLVNCVKGDIQDRARKHKDLADITARVMGNPILSPSVRGIFEKIQVFFIIRGTIQNNALFTKVFATINPPLDDLRKCVRIIISYVLWVSKYREEYYIRCRSKEESYTIATEFMNQSMREVDVALTEAMGALCDNPALV